MPKIRCHYNDCAFLDDGYCSAALVEINPDKGCLTYNPIAETEHEDDWDDTEEEESEELEEEPDEEDEDWNDDEEEFSYAHLPDGQQSGRLLILQCPGSRCRGFFHRDSMRAPDLIRR
jgi:hypothetical protein